MSELKLPEMEEVAGFPGYFITRDGRMFSEKRGCIKELVQFDTCAGYKKANMYLNGKRKQVETHRLVAIAFIPNTFGAPQVNHIDSVRNNNRVENLEWVTASENMQHMVKSGRAPSFKGSRHGQAKIAEVDVLAIRARYAAGEKGIFLAAEYGLSRGSISHLINKKTWSHV